MGTPRGSHPVTPVDRGLSHPLRVVEDESTAVVEDLVAAHRVSATPGAATTVSAVSSASTTPSALPGSGARVPSHPAVHATPAVEDDLALHLVSTTTIVTMGLGASIGSVSRATRAAHLDGAVLDEVSDVAFSLHSSPPPSQPPAFSCTSVASEIALSTADDESPLNHRMPEGRSPTGLRMHASSPASSKLGQAGGGGGGSAGRRARHSSDATTFVPPMGVSAAQAALQGKWSRKHHSSRVKELLQVEAEIASGDGPLAPTTQQPFPPLTHSAWPAAGGSSGAVITPSSILHNRLPMPPLLEPFSQRQRPMLSTSTYLPHPVTNNNASISIVDEVATPLLASISNGDLQLFPQIPLPLAVPVPRSGTGSSPSGATLEWLTHGATAPRRPYPSSDGLPAVAAVMHDLAPPTPSFSHCSAVLDTVGQPEDMQSSLPSAAASLSGQHPLTAPRPPATEADRPRRLYRLNSRSGTFPSVLSSLLSTELERRTSHSATSSTAVTGTTNMTAASPSAARGPSRSNSPTTTTTTTGARSFRSILTAISPQTKQKRTYVVGWDGDGDGGDDEVEDEVRSAHEEESAAADVSGPRGGGRVKLGTSISSIASIVSHLEGGGSASAYMPFPRPQLPPHGPYSPTRRSSLSAAAAVAACARARSSSRRADADGLTCRAVSPVHALSKVDDPEDDLASVATDDEAAAVSTGSPEATWRPASVTAVDNAVVDEVDERGVLEEG